MVIGEKMSLLTKDESVFEGINGDFYESQVALILGHPLDFGRTFYIKVLRAFPDQDHVEVYWNHINGTCIAEIGEGDRVVRDAIHEFYVTNRKQRLELMDKIIERLREEVAKWQQQSSSDADRQDSSLRRQL